MGLPPTMLAPWITWPIVIILIKLPFVLFGILSYLKKSAQETADEIAKESSLLTSDYIDDKVSINSICRCIRFPISSYERQVLFSRYKANIHRFRYLTFHISIALIFYSYPYSVLTENIKVYDNYSFNVFFHIIQFIAICIYFRVSYMDPGIIQTSQLAKYVFTETSPTEQTPLMSNEQSSTSVIVKTRMEYKYDFGMTLSINSLKSRFFFT